MVETLNQIWRRAQIWRDDEFLLGFEFSCVQTSVEGLNVINDPKCNKVFNVTSFCPKYNELLSCKLQ